MFMKKERWRIFFSCCYIDDGMLVKKDLLIHDFMYVGEHRYSKVCQWSIFVKRFFRYRNVFTNILHQHPVVSQRLTHFTKFLEILKKINNTLFGLYKTRTFVLKIKYHSSPSESLHANLSKRSQKLRICSSRVSSTSIVGSD